MIRLHVDAPFAKDAALAPSPEQARYLVSVMRQGVGDELLLFNGRDGEWRGRIAEVSKKTVRLDLVEQVRPQAYPQDLDLIVALVKRARLETIVEKAAELGAARVRLMISERTNADHTNVARLSAIGVEAAEQTGRLDVPQILPPQKLDRLIDAWDDGRRLLFCDEAGEAPSLIDAPLEPGPWAILIGPEGGFSQGERARLRELAFTVPASLGPRILRADTAAIAALSLWQSRIGDWKP